jgi:sugar/nucleoside kinase (ribokinase family)
VFRHDIRAAGIAFDTLPTKSGAPTARCLVLVTPDAQRTMNTYLGACVELGPEDIDPFAVGAAQVTYLEGYLWDPPRAKEAFRKAAELAHAAGRKVSLTLSDPFCVERHRVEFRDLVRHHVDVLFANEAEILSLYEVKEFDRAVAAVRQECELTAVTRSAAGSVVVTRNDVQAVKAAPVARVVDTTGAGDLYASGFLYGYTRGRPPAECARLGAIAAAEVISHVGARPDVALKTLIGASA